MDMIEMMARAMAAADSAPEDSELFRVHWEQFGGGYIRGATAALKALREPTPAMQEAMDELAGTINPVDCWYAAIDTALAGEGKDG